MEYKSRNPTSSPDLDATSAKGVSPRQAVVDGAAETQLLEAAMRGDRLALMTLLTKARADLVRKVGRRIPSSLVRIVSAEDVVQEALIDIFRGIEAFENRNVDAFSRWTAAIALRRLRRLIRRHRAAKRAATVSEPVPANPQDRTPNLLDAVLRSDDTPSQMFSRREQLALLRTAMASLSDPNRQALQLVYLDGFNALQAAERMGRSQRAVHGLCRRGIEKLRQRMNGVCLYMAHVSR